MSSLVPHTQTLISDFSEVMKTRSNKLTYSMVNINLKEEIKKEVNEKYKLYLTPAKYYTYLSGLCLAFDVIVSFIVLGTVGSVDSYVTYGNVNNVNGQQSNGNVADVKLLVTATAQA